MTTGAERDVSYRLNNLSLFINKINAAVDLDGAIGLDAQGWLSLRIFYIAHGFCALNLGNRGALVSVMDASTSTLSLTRSGGYVHE